MRKISLLVLLAGVPQLAPAQDVILIEALAPILRAEDRRELDLQVLGPALEHPEATIRRAAVVAIGRIGAPDGVILLRPRLRDSQAAVVTEAIFALGLLRDKRGATAIIQRLREADSLSADALAEAATALARIGGDESVRVLTDVIGGSGDLPRQRREGMLANAMIDSWHLGAAAPTAVMLPYLRDTTADLRWRATFVLGRLMVPSAGGGVLQALRDQVPIVRETAARSLTRRFADSTGLTHRQVLSELERAIDDEQAGVRINALMSAAGFRDTMIAERVAARLKDSDRMVRVAAASALAAIGGSVAIKALSDALDEKDAAWPVRRNALLGLAALDTAGLSQRAAPWLSSASVFDRIAGLEAIGTKRGRAAGDFSPHLQHQDSRVRAAALDAWRQSSPTDPELAAAAVTATRDTATVVRIAALNILTRTPSSAGLGHLGSAWNNGSDDIKESVLGILIRWSRTDSTLLARLNTPEYRGFLQRPASHALYGQAARGWPALAQQWGAPVPIETGRTIADYREIARLFALATVNPRIKLETDERGTIEVELLAREAPLTVANMLRLVDRRYFDNSRWHRVVPNFVIQDGDPTGTGNGGPGWAIRDEINRRRYLQPMLGMALSGPDTGGSQWFINLSPQPHLDGIYTIFGRVIGSYSPVRRVLQGDVIRSIRR